MTLWKGGGGGWNLLGPHKHSSEDKRGGSWMSYFSCFIFHAAVTTNSSSLRRLAFALVRPAHLQHFECILMQLPPLHVAYTCTVSADAYWRAHKMHLRHKKLHKGEIAPRATNSGHIKGWEICIHELPRFLQMLMNKSHWKVQG